MSETARPDRRSDTLVVVALVCLSRSTIYQSVNHVSQQLLVLSGLSNDFITAVAVAAAFSWLRQDQARAVIPVDKIWNAAKVRARGDQTGRFISQQ